jgi:cytochrome c peroxidase
LCSAFRCHIFERHDCRRAKARAIGRTQTLGSAGSASRLYAASIPADNPQAPDKIALGKKLFFDARLSADNSTACATCHDPDKGFSDQLTTSKGIHNQFGHRNAPTILNAMFNVTQFWDGRVPSLEERAKLPILNPIEIGQKAPEVVVAKLGGIAEYREDFQKVFARAPDYGDMAKAIAAYERNDLLTHPYFHDGAQDTLWDTIDHYNKGGVQNPFLDGGIQRLGLTEPEIDDLVAFLVSLTSDHHAAAAEKEYARQKALSRTTRPQRDTDAAMGINAKGPGLKGPFGDVAPNPTEEDPARIGGR